ncbi:MAG: ABC transporter ATP-binding protein [Pseudomonadota bacterium]
MNLLDARQVEVAYGGIRAVQGIDLSVAPGELVCLIGANGAGKTTTLRALCGLTPATVGEVWFDGQRIDRLPVHEHVRLGIAHVPEGRGIFGRLTVRENLLLGAYLRRDREGIRRDEDRVYELFPRLAERQRQPAGTLSGGEQQMLAIGRALMGRPRLLLLDEPSMGLAPILVQKIFEIIRRISKEGVTMLLVEQNAKLALEVSNRAYVLESGRVVLSGPAAELAINPQVRAAYLGG